MFNESNSIKIPVKSLKRALSHIRKLIGSNVLVAALENVVIRDIHGHVTVSASDLQTVLTANVAINSSHSLDVCFLVNFKRFSSLINLLSCEHVYLRHEDMNVFLNCEEGNFQFHSESLMNYPKMPSVEPQMPFVIEDFQLKEALSMLVNATSADDLRPAMTCVNFSCHEDFLVLAATDGHRLLSYTTGVKFATHYSGNFNIQRKTAKILQGLQSSQNFKFAIGRDNAAIWTGDYTVITRLITETYPNYREVIPKKEYSVVSQDFVLAGLRRKIALAGIFSNMTTHQIKISFGREIVHISSSDLDYSSTSEQIIPIPRQEREVMEVGLNAKLLLDTLKPFKGNVTFHVFAPNKGVLLAVESEYAKDISVLVMPVMLNTYI